MLVAVEKMLFATIRSVVAAGVMFPLGYWILGSLSIHPDGVPLLIVTIVVGSVWAGIGMTLGTFVPPTRINIMFALILTPLISPVARQYPWPSLSGLRWFQVLTSSTRYLRQRDDARRDRARLTAPARRDHRAGDAGRDRAVRRARHGRVPAARGRLTLRPADRRAVGAGQRGRTHRRCHARAEVSVSWATWSTPRAAARRLARPAATPGPARGPAWPGHRRRGPRPAP